VPDLARGTLGPTPGADPPWQRDEVGADEASMLWVQMVMVALPQPRQMSG
jgi:hypothetical protein